MATNFVQSGDVMTYTAGGTISSGDPVQFGQSFGVALIDATSGNPVEVAMTGVWTLPKVSAQAWTEGALIYWTGTACTTTATGSLLIGTAAAAAANPSATGVVRLNGAARPDEA